MTLNINGNNYNYSINAISRIQFPVFKGIARPDTGAKDSFVATSELSPYLSKSAIENMIAVNPQVLKILKTNGLKPEINIEELHKLADGHLKQTKNIAAGIIDNLPKDVRSQIDRQGVIQAAVFHDFGKVLIPNKILNKKTKLNDKEKEIMNLHSILGYELLKTQNISPKALELIKYHHQNASNTGDPINTGDFEYGVEAEIIALADKYSALIEKRSYKPAMMPKEALAILKEESQGSLVLDALVKYIETTA